jgi:hypothetical protein
MREKNRVGGGARTNVNGLHFEQTTSLESVIESVPNFRIEGDTVLRDGKAVGILCGKHKLYKNILEPRGIDARTIVSKKLLPDEAILVGTTVYIIEKKFQSGPGSVDEKLQTCDFKKKQYGKLLSAAGYKVEYLYVFNSWFKQPEYKDVHEYIISVGCKYFFDEIPLEALDLA